MFQRFLKVKFHKKMGPGQVYFPTKQSLFTSVKTNRIYR